MWIEFSGSFGAVSITAQDWHLLWSCAHISAPYECVCLSQMNNVSALLFHVEPHFLSLSPLWIMGLVGTTSDNYTATRNYSQGRPFPFLSFPFLSFPFLSFPFLSCPVLSCPVLSCPVLSCPVLSCPFLSFPFLSFPSLFLFLHPSHSILYFLYCSICPSLLFCIQSWHCV